MTSWADVVAAAMVQIDDVQLTEQLAVSAAQFYRRMAAFITQALPLLSRPPELRRYLQREMVVPLWDDYEWTSTAESMTDETVLQTGKTGFELCSAVIIRQEHDGRISYYPYSGEIYDPDTGDVAFPVQAAEGTRYMLDFYTDGSFADLSYAQMRLFAMAVAVVWNERFDNTWLNLTPKIKDESFDTVNESNYMEKSSQRLQRVIAAFTDELGRYEQDCKYASVLKNPNRDMTLI